MNKPSNNITVETLENGLTIIVEEMPHVESAAYSMLIPGGMVADPEGKVGASLLLAELTSRGAGNLSSREISEEFDSFGIRHSESSGQTSYGYSGTLLAQYLPKAMKLVSKMIQEPTLPEDEIDSIRSLLLQDIASIYDNPGRQVMHELNQLYFPEPYNRPSSGRKDDINSIALSDMQSLWSNLFGPKKAILSIAGKVTAQDTIAQTSEIFGQWKGATQSKPAFGAVNRSETRHVTVESSQTQIALAYPSAEFGHKYYYAAKVLLQVLSGGMFGRLFIEVREKRGLCYSVYARHSATLDYGTVVAYAGTTPERASETLNVLTKELENIGGTVTEEELIRAKTNLKATLVMNEESSGGRAGSNATDWWLIQRLRSLAEITAAIDAVTLKDLAAVSEMFPPKPHMLVTLGAKGLSG